MVSKPLTVDPVLAAVQNAPIGPSETPDERAAVLAAMVESEDGAPAVSQEEVVRKLAASGR